ncbi:TonB-dependent receptor plug domain-containing protein [Sphingobacterium sp. DK4209]|uniref:TonB-dependent receptor plug domain-containing protein n=1 Tax=Sphingobacterium zhuxiongii TaxID=2662364 RepID=A0A5Q0QET0_9SPHI|nr:MULTISPECIES: TonB-dependent receptor [unclassified Sphingobacterium]MVZ65926.1 TonB-dependent receptor plug domain-containing protein [Sphingobacterium sp. DK4209]QGA28063.1 TonB-dependent receptor plug domain-containing protein [Sphingobacterium sp. dk4302]
MRLFTLFLLFIFPIISKAQTAEIIGVIYQKGKKPLANANIYIDGSYDGANSDSLGRFNFKTTLTGEQLIKVSAIGYQSKQQLIQIKDTIYLEMILQTDQRSIEEVVVRAGQFKVGQQANAVLSPLDIVTTAGSMGNIIAALDKLPGAQIAGENGRLMVRGGDPSETQTYINGLRVAQPYTASTNGVPVRGRFSPFLFKGTSFSTGGYSAEFGNALSSILNLSTDLNLAEPKSEISISSVGLGLSNTRRWKNSSLSMNGTYTNLAPYVKLVNQQIDWIKPYQQANAEGIFRNKGDKHFFNLYSAVSFEKFSFKDYAIEYDEKVKTAIEEKNIYLNSNYLRYLENNWKWEMGGSFGYANKRLNYYNFQIPTQEYSSHLKTLWRKKHNNQLQYSFGAEHFYQKVDEQFKDTTQQFVYGFKRQLLSTFAEMQYTAFSRLYITAGARYNNQFRAQQSLEPRASIGYEINSNHQVSLSYGIFHQQIREEIAKYNANLDWQKAQHYIFNYSYSRKNQMLRLELFQKDYSQLLQYDSATPNYRSNFQTNGYGTVRGVDLFWRDSKSIKNFQYWISYSYTDAKKLERNYQYAVQPDYVAKHYFSIVTKYWYAPIRSQLSLTNTYISGRPFNNPNESGFMQFKTSGRNDLSFSWSYLLTQQKIIFFSVTNILGNEPIYGYQYRSTPDQHGKFAGEAIRPNAKRFVFLGFFWTISKNRKDNQLDNL